MNPARVAGASIVQMLVATLLACGGENSPSSVQPPGEPESAKTRALEAGAELTQEMAPLDALDAYLDGFHFTSGNMKDQVEAHHYCGSLNEDVIQCVLYDGNGQDAKLMGIEYIVSREVFATLPTEEKHLWHSHVHEVRSGELIAPGIPEAAEHELLEKIASTYGKTWHTWHTREKLPLGIPMLVMGFTQLGQVDPQLVADRDKRFGVSTEKKREERADIEYPPIDPEADAWQKGIVIQLQAKRLDVKR